MVITTTTTADIAAVDLAIQGILEVVATTATHQEVVVATTGIPEAAAAAAAAVTAKTTIPTILTIPTVGTITQVTTTKRVVAASWVL